MQMSQYLAYHSNWRKLSWEDVMMALFGSDTAGKQRRGQMRGIRSARQDQIKTRLTRCLSNDASPALLPEPVYSLGLFDFQLLHTGNNISSL